MTAMDRLSRLAWLRLNADGVLLAFLAVSTGLNVTDPQGADFARYVDFVPPTFYLWTAGYMLGGVLMAYAFARKRIPSELLGRLLLCISYLVETGRVGDLSGWDLRYMVTQAIVGAVLILACSVRASTLLSKHGVAVVIPGRDKPPPQLEEDR